MNNPVVSVLIPAYKQAEYISECLDSLKAQSFADWEALIVDDGSPDNVADVVKPYIESDPRFKFYHTENSGVSGARNYAADLAKGEFLLPLDADDTIEPSYIEKCVAYFRANPSTRLVYCRWRYFGASDHAPMLKYRGFRELLLTNSIFCTSMFRISDFRRVGGYDVNMRKGLEDWEFLIRFLSDGGEVYQIPEQLFNYRIKAVSRNVDANQGETRLECFNYVYNKHQALYVREFGSPLLALHELYFEAQRYRRKYYNVWYRRLWHSIVGHKKKSLYLSR